MRIFEDVVVLDLSLGPAGGLASTVLADLGADVVKVEPPGGDPERTLANAPLWLRGKRSAVLDIDGRGEDRAALHRLVAGADVVLVSHASDQGGARGTDWATLSALNPALVYCALSGWGRHGPYAGYAADEAVVAARSGRMQAFAGTPRRAGPVFAAVQVATHGAAQAAVQGIVAALIERLGSGRGQCVETSLLQGMIPFDTAGLTRLQMAARYPERLPAEDEATRQPTIHYQPVMARDGRWLQLGNLLEHLFRAYLRVVGLSPAGPGAEAREALRDSMLERMRERDAADWLAAFRADGNVAATRYQTTQQALDDPDLVEAGDVVTVAHARLGTVTQVAPIAQFEVTPGVVTGDHPEVGAHTAQVLASPPRRRPQASAPAAAATPGDGRGAPLSGITVLEFASIIATPLGISMLADLGARVIKVEPIGGDPGRRAGGAFAAGLGSVKYNVGKQSLCLDLKSPRGQALLGRLLARADLVAHNFRPGVPEKLGFGYEQCRRANPRVVWLSANGYGPGSPNADSPCSHPIAGAQTGGALYQAGAGMPPSTAGSVAELREAARWLMRANEVNPDPSTSCIVASAALAGLYAARRHGVGQRVFVDMMRANLWANADDAIRYAGKPPRRQLDAELLGVSATRRLYAAASGWVLLSAESDAAFAAFSAHAGVPALAADPRFADVAARAAHDAELAQSLAGLFATRDADAWESALAPHGIGCVRADGPSPGAFWMHDPHVAANGLRLEREHVRYGRYVRHGPVVGFSRSAVTCGAGTLAGEHNAEVLASIGCTADEIAALAADGVTWAEPVPLP
jgi:crotonobetainyl-CoA:carnitine CoA-transferase CaiB-like acyl-CoA transferase